MAGEIKISALPLASAAADADVTAGVQSGTTVKQTNSALATYMDAKLQATGHFLLSANNLSDLTNVPTARTNLGLGTAAVENVEFFTLQEVWGVSSPKQIQFTLGTGLEFKDSIGSNVVAIGDTSDPASTFFEVSSTVYGSISEPVMTETERNAIDVSGTPTGLGVFNETTKTRDYYDSTSWQKILTTQNVSGTGTVTVTDNGDGTIDVFGSGGGTGPLPSFAAYSVINNLAPRPATTSFGAVPVSSGFTDVSDANFTSQTMTIAGVNTVGSTYTGTVTADFSVTQACVLRPTATSFREYYYAIAILRQGGSIETTDYRAYASRQNTLLSVPATMTGTVTLAQGDTVFTQISSASSDANDPTYTITSEVSTIAGSSAPTLQDVYNNDPSYPSAEVNLGVSGSIQFNYGSEISLGAGSNGIGTTLGLRLLPSNGIESIEALVTDNPDTAIFTVVSTIRGSKPLPDMTTAQRDLVTGSKPVALGIYNSSLNTPQFWTTDNTWMSLINSQYDQTIGGVKTFSSNIIGNLTGNADTATIAGDADNINTLQTSTNVSYFPLLSASTTNGYNQVRLIASGFTVNGSTAVVTMNGLNIVGATASQPLFTDSSKNVTSTGTVQMTHGGLGFTTATIGDIFLATTTNGPGKLSDVATGSVLVSGGVGALPAYSASPTLTGLNLSGLTASSMVVTDSSKNLASSPLPLGQNAIVTISSSTQVMAVQTTYVNKYTGGQMAATLPAATGSGKIILIVGDSTASTSGWKVTGNGTDVIQLGASVSAAGGNVASTPSSATDCATFLDSGSGKWIIYDSLGTNLIIT